MIRLDLERRLEGAGPYIAGGIIGFLVAMFFASLLIALTPTKAVAHEFWINQGQYKGRDGVHCCGEKDCPSIAPEDVIAGPDGYILKTYGGETVPYSEATPSEQDADGVTRFYRCHDSTGKRRCFFAPYGGA